MKSRITYIAIVSLIWTLVASGCQEPLTEIEEPSEDEAITMDSPLTDLMRRVALMDGSYDNVIDSASCLSIEMPYTITANSTQLTISTLEDIQVVEALFATSDSNSIVFVYPLTITSPYFIKKVVDNQTEFAALQQQCSNAEDEDIECIDFVYPVSLSVYDEHKETAVIKTVSTDEAMYSFLTLLAEDEYAAIQYPISMVDDQNISVTIENNIALENEIEGAINACDEGDEVDNGQDPKPTDLETILKAGNWKVTFYFNEKDTTSAFDEHIFEFESNRVLKAKVGDVITNGEWSIDEEEENGKPIQILEMEFEDSEEPLKWLDEEWEVTNFSELKVEMKSESENNEPSTILTIERI